MEKYKSLFIEYHEEKYDNTKCDGCDTSKEFIEDKYSLICDYLYWLMETSNNMRTKIYMTDISKKLLIQNPTITTVQEIQHYFFRFYQIINK
jgi:hypothetical protein